MVLTGWLIATVLGHAGQAVYDLPAWAVALGVGAAAVAFVGWMLVIRSIGWTGVVVAVLGALVVASIGVIPILGVFGFVGGLVALASTAQGSGDRRGLAGGLLVALGLPLAALVATDGPLVRCRDGGASTSSSIFRPGSSRVAGSDASSGTSQVEGELDSGGRRFRYRCEGDRLVELRRT